jgi:phenylpropionate dioxygenase-like ring-hydroxylating dioxygenase large terminal subunit
MLGKPLVIWRDSKAQVVAHVDRCPHRGAPLSLGSVCAGAIACPYHGWQFDGEGLCVAMPALKEPVGQVRLDRFEAYEVDGFILVREVGHAASDVGLPRRLVAGGHQRQMVQMVQSDLVDLAENALDTTHTSVVHAGYLRAPNRLAPVQPVVKTGPDWIEAHYPPKAAPSGLLGQIAGGQRYSICDRFRAPGIAEIEYRHGDRVVFAVAFYFTPTAPGQILIHASIQAPGVPWVAAFKTWIAKLLLGRVFAEDTAMLAAISTNLGKFPTRTALIMPQDLLRAGIAAIIAGREPRQPTNVPEILV